MRINKERILTEQNINVTAASLVSDLLLTTDLSIEDCSTKKLPQRIAESDPGFIIDHIDRILELFKDFSFFKIKKVFNIGAPFLDADLNELKIKLLELKDGIPVDSNQEDEDRHKMLTEFIEYINGEITHVEDILIEPTRESVHMMILSRQIASYAVLESSFAVRMDIIAANINYNPSAVKDYGKLLSDIERSSKSEILNNAVDILNDNTKLLTLINTSVGPNMEHMICELPIVLAYRIIEENKGVISRFSKAIDIQMKILENVLKDGEPKFYDLYSNYVAQLDRAKDILTKESNKVVTESNSDDYDELYEDQQMYSETLVDDFSADMDDLSLDILFDDLTDDNEEELIESYVQRVIVAEQNYSVALEKAKKTNKIGAVNKLAHKASKNISRGKKTVGDAARPIAMLAKTVDKMIEDVVKMDKNARRDAIITGGWKGKLKSMLRKIILMIGSYAALTALIPLPGLGGLTSAALKIISFFIGVALDKKTRVQDRRLIIKDLELELKMVEEKINDSRSDSNPKAKYELMRIQNKLERELEKVQYGV